MVLRSTRSLRWLRWVEWVRILSDWVEGFDCSGDGQSRTRGKHFPGKVNRGYVEKPVKEKEETV
jgi:hypothetical protein